MKYENKKTANLVERKKKIREAFCNVIFARDGNKRRFCQRTDSLDAHHITDRNLLPSGGYVKENGITLCPEHHQLAEVFHSTGTPAPGFSVQELYTLINSSVESAQQASTKLSRKT